jgi:hypothetical protein
MEVRAMRTKTTGKVLPYDPYNFNAEPGDIMVDFVNGRAWRLYETPGARSRSGELSMRELKKPGMIATIQENKLVWIPK